MPRGISPEIKMLAVKGYMSEKGFYRKLAVKYNIPSKSMIRQWVLKYHGHDEDIGIRGFSADLIGLTWIWSGSTAPFYGSEQAHLVSERQDLGPFYGPKWGHLDFERQKFIGLYRLFSSKFDFYLQKFGGFYGLKSNKLEFDTQRRVNFYGSECGDWDLERQYHALLRIRIGSLSKWFLCFCL